MVKATEMIISWMKAFMLPVKMWYWFRLYCGSCSLDASGACGGGSGSREVDESNGVLMVIILAKTYKCIFLG